jgi:hypothetical protein
MVTRKMISIGTGFFSTAFPPNGQGDLDDGTKDEERVAMEAHGGCQLIESLEPRSVARRKTGHGKKK